MSCQSVAACVLLRVATSSFHLRGQSVMFHAALQSLSRQPGTRYQNRPLSLIRHDSFMENMAD